MSPDEITDLRERLAAATDPGETATSHRRLGTAYRRVAGQRAGVDGDYRTAREAFERSAVHYRQCAETTRLNRRIDADDEVWEDHPAVLRDGLATAVLAGDGELRRETVTEALATPEKYVETFPEWAYLYYYVKTCACAVAGHRGADTYFEATRREIADHEATDSVDEPGLWMALNGILDDDPGHVREGLATNVAEFHGAAVAAPRPGHEHIRRQTPAGDRAAGGIPVRAAATAVLARREGYGDAVPDSPALPGELLGPPADD